MFSVTTATLRMSLSPYKSPQEEASLSPVPSRCPLVITDLVLGIMVLPFPEYHKWIHAACNPPST